MHLGCVRRREQAGHGARTALARRLGTPMSRTVKTSPPASAPGAGVDEGRPVEGRHGQGEHHGCERATAVDDPVSALRPRPCRPPRAQGSAGCGRPGSACRWARNGHGRPESKEHRRRSGAVPCDRPRPRSAQGGVTRPRSVRRRGRRRCGSGRRVRRRGPWCRAAVRGWVRAEAIRGRGCRI